MIVKFDNGMKTYVLIQIKVYFGGSGNKPTTHHSPLTTQFVLSFLNTYHRYLSVVHFGLGC